MIIIILRYELVAWIENKNEMNKKKKKKSGHIHWISIYDISFWEDNEVARVREVNMWG